MRAAGRLAGAGVFIRAMENGSVKRIKCAGSDSIESTERHGQSQFKEEENRGSGNCRVAKDCS